ncbi:uncharacterized protein [Henckelia pumila]|uniref:uncharacterized protein n=1 Tax=Henckelia pumila TaxID=405737 RepID=UPI003C6E0900
MKERKQAMKEMEAEREQENRIMEKDINDPNMNDVQREYFTKMQQAILRKGSWEGSAANARVLRDAITQEDGLKVPRGCYYLCDNGYANVVGFLTPYRRTRYHLNDWTIGATSPQNYKEYFNSKHCRARNVIERAFGLLKRRWAVLRSPTFYSLQVQNRMILACMLLHNFIRFEMPEDPLEEVDEASNCNTENIEEYFIDNIESSPSWELWRDDLAMSMYNS